jgi:hypothetical protein
LNRDIPDSWFKGGDKMPDTIRERNLRRALELFKVEINEGSLKFESAFADLMSDIDEYPEIESITMQAQTLYLKSQDLIAEVIKLQKDTVKT